MTRDATPGDVPAAFDAGAPVYDALVGANPGYHAHLRLSAKRMQLPDGGRGLRPVSYTHLTLPTTPYV